MKLGEWNKLEDEVGFLVERRLLIPRFHQDGEIFGLKRRYPPSQSASEVIEVSTILITLMNERAKYRSALQLFYNWYFRDVTAADEARAIAYEPILQEIVEILARPK